MRAALLVLVGCAVPADETPAADASRPAVHADASFGASDGALGSPGSSLGTVDLGHWTHGAAAEVDPIEALADDAADLADLPAGTCRALLDPWTPREAADVLRIWSTLAAREWWTFTEYFAPEPGSCPSAEDPAEADAWNCTTSTGWTVVGQYHWGTAPGGNSWNELSSWGVAHTDDTGAYRYLADGDLHTTTITSTMIGLRESIQRDGGFGTGRSTRIRDGQIEQRDGWTVTAGAYVRIVEDDALPKGDLCVVSDLAAVDGCDLEPTGTFRLEGAEDVVATFDGDVACDGCGTVTAGGAPLGTICELPRFW